MKGRLKKNNPKPEAGEVEAGGNKRGFSFACSLSKAGSGKSICGFNMSGRPTSLAIHHRPSCRVCIIGKLESELEGGHEISISIWDIRHVTWGLFHSVNCLPAKYFCKRKEKYFLFELTYLVH